MRRPGVRIPLPPVVSQEKHPRILKLLDSIGSLGLHLLRGSRTGSRYLTELAKNKPERVRDYRGHGGKHKFEIFFVVEGKPVTNKPITVQTKDGTLVEGEAIPIHNVATVKTTNGETVSGQIWSGTLYGQTADLKTRNLAGKK
jgi:hypothetical protein